MAANVLWQELEPNEGCIFVIAVTTHHEVWPTVKPDKNMKYYME